MGFVMKNGRTGLDAAQARGERDAPDVAAVGGAASLTVTVSFPHAGEADVFRVAYYPRGSEAPMQAFVRPAPLAEARIELTAENPVGEHVFADVPAGDYDVYYHLRAGRDGSAEWTNIAPDRLTASPAPLRATVGAVAGHGVSDVSGFFGAGGSAVTLGL